MDHYTTGTVSQVADGKLASVDGDEMEKRRLEPRIDTCSRQGCHLKPTECVVPDGSATAVARTRAEKSRMS